MVSLVRVLVAVLTIAQWSGCVLPSRSVSAPTEPEARAEAFERRFDRVDRLIRLRYYDRNFNGVAWDELTARYRPRAIRAADEVAWYQTVNEMLEELRDAHTRVSGPEPETRHTMRKDAVVRPLMNPGRAKRVWPDGVVYLRFGQFDDASLQWLRREIDAHQDAPGMVLDLRHNHGGLVTCAQRAVGLFFTERVAMGLVVNRSGRRTVERSRPSLNPRYLGPLVVLVGPDSRSSAEVFAYAMQHHDRALIVGQATAGQVLGARPYRLPDGGQLYISVSDFHCLQSGRLEGEGVNPDLRAASPRRIAAEFDPDVAADPGLQAALQSLRTGARPGLARSQR